jgi:uncharacterized protein (DUF433 family)
MVPILEPSFIFPKHAAEKPRTNPMDWVATNPEQCGGRLNIRGMRIRVIDVIDLLAAGLNADQIPEELPDLKMEDIKELCTCRRRILPRQAPLFEGGRTHRIIAPGES